MFDGIRKRVVCMWFPRLASDRALRARALDGPFALTLKEHNSERLYCLNAQAEELGLHCGMSLADARAFCPNLISHPARPDLDARFLSALRRWATRYCPWVGHDGPDGLVLDVTGSTHLWGGEAAMLDDMRMRASHAGLTLRLGLADTRGTAWALAHHTEGISPMGAARDSLFPLPIAALRLDEQTCTLLQRLGLRRIGDLAGAARAPLTRRFGPGLLARLDQALGILPEPVSPETTPPHYGARMTLPEPIGLSKDVMGVTARLLEPLCQRLLAQQMGARRLTLTLRRVDQGHQQVELRLAAPMRDPQRILPLFTRGIETIDAGFGIDQLRLEATQVEALPIEQTNAPLHDSPQVSADRLTDLITRIGMRIGLENIHRLLPADSHIPDRAFLVAPAAFASADTGWPRRRPRPLQLFPAEPIPGTGHRPPPAFRWRRMPLTTARATGPERIAPEWWMADDAWHSGVRDYWKVETAQGRRLWLFHTPQNPGWFVQGEFA